MMFELHHCDKFYLFKNKPEHCPTCYSLLLENNFTTPTLNEYLTASRSTSNAVVIKPTKGLFENYETNQDLHIGLTDKLGNLYHFDEHGLQFGSTQWSECFKLGSIDSFIKDHLIKHSADKSSNSLLQKTAKNKNKPIDNQANQTDDRKHCATSTQSDREQLLSKNKSIGSNEFKATSEESRFESESNKELAYELALIGDYWNYTIQICKNDKLIRKKFNSQTYHQLENNCLDFVFFFFKLLDLDRFNQLKNKIEFCEQFVQPRLSELFRIIEFDRCDSSANRYLIIKKDF